MGRPRKNKTAPAIQLQSEPEPASQITSVDVAESTSEPGSENFPARSAPVDRLSFKLIDGKISFDGMRESTQEKAREVVRASLADPDFRKRAGLSEDDPETKVTLCPPLLVGQALDMIASFEALALAKRTGLTFEETMQIIKWSAEEHEVLDAQGAKIAGRYIPAAWLEKGEIFMFVMSIGALTAQKMKMVSDYATTKLERMHRLPDPRVQQNETALKEQANQKDAEAITGEAPSVQTENKDKSESLE